MLNILISFCLRKVNCESSMVKPSRNNGISVEKLRYFFLFLREMNPYYSGFFVLHKCLIYFMVRTTVSGTLPLKILPF